MNILYGNRFLYLLIFFFFSVSSEAKVVLCSDQVQTELEGFLRMILPKSEVIAIFGQPLADCLKEVEDGDVVYIMTHSQIFKGSTDNDVLGFIWGGSTYDGFHVPGGPQGLNSILLPQGFDKHKNVEVKLVICYAGGHPQIPGMTLAEKFITAMGGNSIKKSDYLSFVRFDDNEGNSVVGSKELVAVSTSVKLMNLTESQGIIKSLVYDSINRLSYIDNVFDLNTLSEVVVENIKLDLEKEKLRVQESGSEEEKKRFSGVDLNDPFLPLCVRVFLSKEWRGEAPFNRPDYDGATHNTALSSIFYSSDLPNALDISAYVLVYSLKNSYLFPDGLGDSPKSFLVNKESNEEPCGCEESCDGITSPVVEVTLREDADTLYCLHDEGLNDSQFCYGIPSPTPLIVPLGPLYVDCDIEALDTLHKTDDLYAAAGDNTPRKGHLYYVYKHNGDIVDLGDPNGPGSLDEIDALSFHPITQDLWGWAQGEGLFVINTLPPPPIFPPSPFPANPPFPEGIQIQPVVNIHNPICLKPVSKVPVISASIVLNHPIEVEDITWNWRGDIIYAVENAHTDNVDSHGQHEDLWPYGNPKDYDFDQADIDGDGEIEGVTLWASDGFIIKEVCHDLSPKIEEKLGYIAEIEALESLPPDIIPVADIDPNAEDLLLVGFHGPQRMLYTVVIIPAITSFVPSTECRIWTWLNHKISTSLNDIEGLAYSPFPKPIEAPEGYPHF